MGTFLDQEELPSTRDADTLRAAVAGRVRDIDPKPALAALLQLAPEHPGTLVADLMVDPDTPLDARTAIANALGADPSSVSRSSLIEAVRTGEPPVKRRAALSLARVGKPEDLEGLSGLRIPSTTPAGNALAFARRLISYRHGLGSHRFRVPPDGDLLEMTDRPIAVPSAPMESAEVAEAQAALRTTLPDVLLAGSGVVFSCRGTPVWAVPTRAAVEEPIPEGLAKRDAVAAIAFKRSECPDGAYPVTFVVSHPTRGGGAALLGVSTTGRQTHAGSIGADGRLRVAAVDTPRTIPVELEAILDTTTGGLEIIRVVTARGRARGQKGPQAPPGTPQAPSE